MPPRRTAAVSETAVIVMEVILEPFGCGRPGQPAPRKQ